MGQDKWTPEKVQEVLTNPAYCLTDPPVITEEQWVAGAIKMIEGFGAEEFLKKMLASLRKSFSNPPGTD